MFPYKYEHDHTQSTTGFFSCEPIFDAPWPDSLELLAKRPYDRWLRAHVLGQVAHLPEPERMRFYDFCISQNVMDSVFPKINADFRKNILEQCLASGALKMERKNKNSNAVQEERLKREQLCAMLNANIHRHLPIPENMEDSLSPAVATKKAFRRALSGGKIAGPGNWRDAAEIVRLKELIAEVTRKLTENDFLHENEMRHEAALSPINIMRNYRIKAQVPFGDAPYSLEGVATAYGKGLSLAKARVSCLMEIVERLSAYPSIVEDGSIAKMPQLGKLLLASRKQLLENGFSACFPGLRKPQDDEPFYWLPGKNRSGEKIYVPAQYVFLFLNLPEADLPDLPGSTGLAAHADPESARLTALLEILERHAHASMPHNPQRCFMAASRNELLQSLLDDYRLKGIHVFFEDISAENGVPAYRCFVEGHDGSIAQASSASLNGREAAISAMLETPWPYHYSGISASGEASRRKEKNLPLRFLEDLPDYSSGTVSSDLRMLEDLLEDSGMHPVYIDLTRQDLAFPVFRCLVPQLEINSDFDLTNPPGPALLDNARALLKKKRTD